MGQPGVFAAVVVGLAIIASVAMWRLRAVRGVNLRRAAVASFPAALTEFEASFLAAANATGKPRGLRWIGARLTGEPLFALDRANGELYALMAATISFEAIEDGGMEEVEVVGNLREATAVFVHRGDRWTTDGRAVFNLDPTGALDHYRESLEPFHAS